MRACLCLLLAAVGLYAAEPNGTVVLRGKLTVHDGAPATVETTDHQVVSLDGDDVTKKVLADDRLNGFEVQATGRFTSPGHFLVNPTYTHPFLVRKDGKLKLVSYWCNICSIRAYTPGPCVCCQRETALDLRDPDQP